MASDQRNATHEHRPLFRWAVIYSFCLEPLGRLVRATVEKITGQRWSGSDAFADYTASYTWFANQFGHSTIGLFYSLFSWVVATAFVDVETDWLTPLLIALVLCLLRRERGRRLHDGDRGQQSKRPKGAAAVL